MNYKNKSGTYTITNDTNGKVYYGSSVNIANRWRQHRDDLRGNRHHNAHLQNAWNTYGPAAFVFAVFDYCDVEDLHAYEQILLDQHVGKDYCYNKAKDAASPMRGRAVTEEHKRKLSEANKGKTLSEAHKAKISEAMKGEKNHNYGKTYRKVTCPHCGKLGGTNAMKRYHFDNCKHRTEEAN